MTSLKSLFALVLVAGVLGSPQSAAAVEDLGSDSTFTPKDLGSFDGSPPDTLPLPLPETEPAVSMAPPAPMSDVLPFAKNDLPRRPFAFGFGGGFGSYVTDREQINSAFRAIEDTYRSEGIPVPGSIGTDIAPMAIWLATAHFEKVMDVSMQLGRSYGSEDQLRMTGGLLSRRIVNGSGELSLTLGAGGGSYGFLFTRKYGTTIATYPDGAYTTLDTITIEGGGSYWTGKTSILIRPGDHVAIDLQGQYFGMSETSAESRAGRISMNLSGYLFGGSITLLL